MAQKPPRTSRRGLIAGGALAGVLSRLGTGTGAAAAPALPVEGVFCPQCFPEHIALFPHIWAERMGSYRLGRPMLSGGETMLLGVMAIGPGWYAQHVAKQDEDGWSYSEHCPNCVTELVVKVVHGDVSLHYDDGRIVTF